MSLKLRKFDMSKMKDGSSCLIISKTGGGKSELIKNILRCKKDIPVGCVICPSEQSDPFYSSFVPKIFIHDDYSPELLKNFVKRQKKATRKRKKNKNIDNRGYLILDDCQQTASQWVRDRNMQYITFVGRHDGIFSIIALQYLMGVPPGFRNNFSYIFILREPFINIRRKIYEFFAGMFPTFEVFNKVMDVCTADYGCIVIDNTTRSNDICDMVFWLKPGLSPDYKTGADVFWQYHYQNPQESDEDEDDGKFDPDQFRRGKPINLNVHRIENNE
jgi:hypothetical protein